MILNRKEEFINEVIVIFCNVLVKKKLLD